MADVSESAIGRMVDSAADPGESMKVSSNTLLAYFFFFLGVKCTDVSVSWV
jgi:hypothetical protein